MGSRASALVRLACVIGALGIALGLLHLLRPATERKGEDLALGAQARSVYSADAHGPLHCGGTTGGDACVAASRSRGHPGAVLWLGNSQVHAINQWQAEDENASPRVARALQSLGTDFVTFSIPNGSIQEHWVIFEWVRARLTLKGVVVALCYDDTRETGLRNGVLEALTDPAVQGRLEEHALGRSMLARKPEAATGGGELAGLDQTVQQRAERALVDWLQSNWDLWAKRHRNRLEVYHRLYRLRNTVFNISPSTKRPKIPARYAENLAAFDALLINAQAAGIPVLAYVVPIRPNAEIPYVQADYQQYKLDTQRLAEARGATWLNWESLVPEALWGSKGGTQVGVKAELDFMHFMATGHAVLADALIRTIRRDLLESP